MFYLAVLIDHLFQILSSGKSITKTWVGQRATNLSAINQWFTNQLVCLHLTSFPLFHGRGDTSNSLWSMDGRRYCWCWLTCWPRQLVLQDRDLSSKWHTNLCKLPLSRSTAACTDLVGLFGFYSKPRWPVACICIVGMAGSCGCAEMTPEAITTGLAGCIGQFLPFINGQIRIR